MSNFLKIWGHLGPPPYEVNVLGDLKPIDEGCRA